MPYPRQIDEASADELIVKVEAFLKEHVDADLIDREERIPQHVIEGLGKLGVLGMVVPKEYGGGGFSHTAYCKVLERISMYCAACGVMIGAHQSIGCKALVLLGTEEQKKTPMLAAVRSRRSASLSRKSAPMQPTCRRRPSSPKTARTGSSTAIKNSPPTRPWPACSRSWPRTR